MNQKIVSQLNAEGYFVGPVVADESPLEPGIFLIPGGAVDKAPPKALEPGKRYKLAGALWRAEPLPEPEPEPEPEPPAVVAPLIETMPEPTREQIILMQLAEIERLQNLQAQADALRAELATLSQ